MEVVVDRIEEDFIVVENNNKIGYISLSLLPDVKEGDILDININLDRRKVIEDEINDLMDELFEN